MDYPSDADGTIGYSATGGNPGGMVFGSPYVLVLGATTIYVPFDFVAPGTYLGNRSTYYNGTLRYDVQQSSTGTPNQYAEVTIANSGGVTLYYFPTTPHQPAAAPTWTTFSVVLNNTNGFWKTTNSPTGMAATEAQILGILTDLAALQIRGLYRDANVTGRLDNVILTAPIVVTTQPTAVSVCDGITATFTTAATGNPTITYRWQFESSPGVWSDLNNGGGYSNVTTATLSVNTAGNFGAGNYRCRISGTNVVDAFSNSATLIVNPLPAAPITTGAARCGTGTVTLTATGGVAGQYRWYTVASGGTAIAGQTNATYTTPTITGTTNYYVAINNGTCESNRTIVTATINPIPGAPTTTGAANCGSGSVTLTAAGGTAGQYRWYTVASGGTAIAGQTNATYTTPTLTGTTNYYVAINNGTCESSRTIVTATINPIPGAPTTTGASRCGSGTVTLAAAGGTAGQYRWYTVASGGTAIAGQTNATYTTPTLTGTTNYYVAINNGTCESNRTIVTATINPIPGAPTTTGAANCGSGSVTLTAAGGTAGQYRWYTVASGGTAIAGQTNATYTTPTLAGTTNYYVAINNGTCESNRTIVIATINSIPGAPTTTGASRCGSGTVTLAAAGGTAGQYRWYTVASGGTAIAGQTNATYTTPTLTGTTNYYVAINNGTCESTRTTLVATINPLPGAPTTTGAESCPAASVTLTASGGTAGQYRWYTVASGGTALAGETNSTFVTPVLTTTTSYYVSINNGTCESNRTEVVATIAVPGCDNVPPVIVTEPIITQVEGIVTINLAPLITDGNNNVDLSTLKIFTPPASGASAIIDGAFNLIIDYSSLSFSGTESITIEVCDIYNACAQQTFSIEVVGEITIYNALSPAIDSKNDFFKIEHIAALSTTRNNKVSIYNRWGTLVWEGTNYNNQDVVFTGKSNNGNDLPSGTYFYKIDFNGKHKTETGYLVLKR
ncbi:MAG: gliding motility-associated C-terminal domain-containing protein [Cyclobacteriaceae bacterium]|nr:MAG: gliding motility-associated C-terminal domain-containing protein [Cyclobacteriaceae bacterium]